MRKGQLFALLGFYVVNHCNGIVATKDVLFAGFQFDKDTVIPASVISNICAYNIVSEIAPESKITSTGTQS